VDTESKTIWVKENGIITYVIVIGNPYWDFVVGYSPHQRRAVCGHEIGHLQLIGHSPQNFPTETLMRPSKDTIELENVYSPRQADIRLVTQNYP
jgi:hypothetical protein